MEHGYYTQDMRYGHAGQPGTQYGATVAPADETQARLHYNAPAYASHHQAPAYGYRQAQVAMSHQPYPVDPLVGQMPSYPRASALSARALSDALKRVNSRFTPIGDCFDVLVRSQIYILDRMAMEDEAFEREQRYYRWRQNEETYRRTLQFDQQEVNQQEVNQQEVNQQEVNQQEVDQQEAIENPVMKQDNEDENGESIPRLWWRQQDV